VSDIDDDQYGYGPMITWAEITRIEPRLDALFEEARAVKYDPEFCTNRIWYELFKPRLVHLVGHEARDTRIGTMRAYDIAYDKIYNALPPCPNCFMSQCLRHRHL
jgi:hypothetical protein